MNTFLILLVLIGGQIEGRMIAEFDTPRECEAAKEHVRVINQPPVVASTLVCARDGRA
ncbi:hypothetical protein [Ralstonia phage P-PSG-11-1]|uniref:Uncharacterized protein n=1 Tax=Ralstonia phage P-PSG-11 TaxID=2652430 RepID=A0A5P8D3Y0_9CAUD|nr:hypothetical protein [Ralstonia phage P-PSG-11]QFP93763.1 hypothetical protein [Ralstonia phage P-PSG-11-1]